MGLALVREPASDNIVGRYALYGCVDVPMNGFAYLLVELKRTGG